MSNSVLSPSERLTQLLGPACRTCSDTGYVVRREQLGDVRRFPASFLHRGFLRYACTCERGRATSEHAELLAFEARDGK